MILKLESFEVKTNLLLDLLRIALADGFLRQKISRIQAVGSAELDGVPARATFLQNHEINVEKEPEEAFD